MAKKIVIFLIASSVLICGGCIFLPLTGYNYEGRVAIGQADFYAKQTIDIGSSSPDMVIHASSTQVIPILRRAGADTIFPHRKSYEHNIRKIYQQEGVVKPEDVILLCTDDGERWISIVVAKVDDERTLLWIRKLSYDSFESEPDSPYHKDWLSIMRNECAMRGIRFTTPNTNSL